MIWCYCLMICSGIVYMCYICFGLQGFKRKQTKTKFTGAFVMCRHTAMRTKVLYHVLTHGKDSPCQQYVDLGAVFEPNGRKTENKHTAKLDVHGKGRHTVTDWTPHPAMQTTDILQILYLLIGGTIRASTLTLAV
jgi:hypothetical protein